MTTEICSSVEIPFQCADIETNARHFYSLVFQTLKSAGKEVSKIRSSKELLKMAGFSQNARNRLIHLSKDEIETICASCPTDFELWCFYMREFQLLLSKLEQACKRESLLEQSLNMGRPYVTLELANTLGKLSHLRLLGEKGIFSLGKSKMHDLLIYYLFRISKDELLGYKNTSGRSTETEITVQSAVSLLEIYCDELIMPPRMKIKRNFDSYQLHMMEADNCRMMDDGGKSFLQHVRDTPLETYYDEMPLLSYVLDWFVAMSPVLDKHQVKLGWGSLEEKSDEWHHRIDTYEFYEDVISEFPSWSCMIEDHYDEWLTTLPPGNPYKLFPLTTPQQLLDETRKMHHCVVTYLDSCISGAMRIFSIRDASNNQRVATVEISIRSGRWDAVQLKGKHNQELIERMNYSNDPMAVILNKLVNWYNARSSIESLTSYA